MMTQKEALTFVIEKTELPAEVKEKLEHMLENLNKKKTGAKSMTPTQKANIGHKAVILEAMAAEPTRLFSISEMGKEFPFTEELSGQRISALITQLKNAALVERIEEKRKVAFRITEAGVEAAAKAEDEVEVEA